MTKKQLTQAIANYARKHGYFARTVRAVSSLRYAAIADSERPKLTPIDQQLAEFKTAMAEIEAVNLAQLAEVATAHAWDAARAEAEIEAERTTYEIEQ